jgi:hypothetical protein
MGEESGPKKGRPTTFTPELGTQICRLIASGKTLRQVSDELKLGGASQIIHWNYLQGEQFDAFRQQYAQAMTERFDFWAEELIEISDAKGMDIVTREGLNGQTKLQVDYENIQRSKLRIEARQWAMARGNPKKFGQKQEHEISGKNGAPLMAAINFGDKPKEE